MATIWDDLKQDFKQENAVGFWVHIVGLRMKSALEANLEPFGVTAVQWGILTRICEREGLIQQELAELFMRDKTNIARVVAKLVAKELVKRQPDPEDRRAIRLYPTDKGRAMRDAMLEEVMKTLSLSLDGFSDEEHRQLLTLLRRIYGNLT